VALDPREYRKLVDSTHAQFTERKLGDDNFVIATPADSTHRTQAGAVIHVFKALEDEKPVTVTIVGVLRRTAIITADRNGVVGHEYEFIDTYNKDPYWRQTRPLSGEPIARTE
jgi:hypothetical protein